MHPSELIKARGDYLEQALSERILNTIPTYATIWSNYVGNNGMAQPLPLLGSSEGFEADRGFLWERLYTILESLALCWTVEKALAGVENINSCEDYLSNINSWSNLHAHMGRIHDMVKGASIRFDRSEWLSPFRAFYERRNIALHGPKMPLKWVDNVLAVPPLGENNGQWHDKMRWNDLTTSHFEFLRTIVSNTLREMEQLIETFFYHVLQYLQSEFGIPAIEWPANNPPARAGNGEFDSPINPSGVEPYRISGSRYS